MKLTVIYHIYSGIKSLKKSLESLFNQTKKTFEIILVDDCATNEAKEILNKFDISSKRITLIRLFENYGRSFCYNLCLEKAKGDYVYFAEAKNIFEPDFVEKIFQKINEKKFDYISFKISSSPEDNIFTEDMEINDDNILNWIVNSSLSLRNKVIRKDFLNSNKIRFVNYKNMYAVYLFQVVSMAKSAYYINKQFIKLENPKNKIEIFSYNLYDILESAFELSERITDSNIDEDTKTGFQLWLSKLCLCDFLGKMFESYQSEKVLTIAINKANEMIDKIDNGYKRNRNISLIKNHSIKEYIQNFKPSPSYVKKYMG